jgi:hypothetical protein
LQHLFAFFVSSFSLLHDPFEDPRFAEFIHENFPSEKPHD